MKNVLLYALFLAALFTTACGGDDDAGPGPNCTSEAYANAVSDEATAFSNAATTFANDPSTANCNAYKNAADNYLDVLESFDNCAVIAGRQDYQQSIQAARDAINSISC